MSFPRFEPYRWLLPLGVLLLLAAAIPYPRGQLSASRGAEPMVDVEPESVDPPEEPPSRGDPHADSNELHPHEGRLESPPGVLEVSPANGSATALAHGSAVAVFTVVHSGGSESLPFDVWCLKDGTNVSACEVVGQTSFDLGPDLFVDVTVRYDTDQPGSSGSVSLVADAAAQADTGSFTVNVTPAPGIAVVTPIGSPATIPGGVNTDTVSFSIANNGSASGDYRIWCQPGPALIKTCTPLDSTVTIAHGFSTNVDVDVEFYSGDGDETITLFASALGRPGKGIFTWTLQSSVGPPQVTGEADSKSFTSAQAGSNATVDFTLENLGTERGGFALLCEKSFSTGGADQGCQMTPLGPVILDGGQDTTVTIDFIVPAAGSVDWIAVRSERGSAEDADTIAIHVGQSTPPSTITIEPRAATLTTHVNGTSSLDPIISSDAGTLFNATVSCRKDGTYVTDCTVADSPQEIGASKAGSGSFTIDAGSSPGTGWVELIVAGNSEADTVRYQVVVTPLPGAPELTPATPTRYVEPNSSPRLEVVAKQSGSADGVYRFSCEAGNPLSCPWGPEKYSLSPNDPLNLSVGFNTGDINDTTSLLVVGELTTPAPGVTKRDTVFATIVPFDGRPAVSALAEEEVPAEQAIDTVRFLVKNPGSATLSYQIQCEPSGAFISCQPQSRAQLDASSSDTLTTLELDQNQQDTLFVLADVGGFGHGTITLTAKIEPGPGQPFTGSAVNEVVVLSAKPPLDLSPTSGARVSRGACVTAAAGPAGAFQCGDLRLGHSMPGFRTRNRSRTLTLNYVSGTAEPHPVIMADLTIPTGDTDPGKVEVELIWNEADTVKQTYDGSLIKPDSSVRIAIPVDLPTAELPTGVYKYVLRAKSMTGSTLHETYTDSAEYVVVDRTASPYGAGWGVSAVGRLHTGQRDGALLLESGDGSAALYEQDPNNSNRWIAPTGAYRDEITLTNSSSGGETTVDYSLDLDGTDYASLAAGQHSGLTGNSAMTWAFWIKPESGSNRIGGVTTGSDPNRVWWMDTDNNGNDLRVMIFNQTSDNPAYVTAPGLTKNAWNFVTVVFDGSAGTVDDRLKIYIDSVLKTDSEAGADMPTTVRTSSGAPFEWGDISSASAPFNGEMGQLSILSQALTQTTIADWFVNGIDFGENNTNAGYRWEDSLEDVTGNGNGLGTSTIPSGAYKSEAGYPTRSTPAATTTAHYLDLDGTEYGSHSAPAPSGLMGQDQMTWAFWIRPTTSSRPIGGITSSTGSARVWWFQTDNAGQELRLTVYNDSISDPSFVNTPGLTANTWQFVVVQYDGTESSHDDRLKVWIDGVLKADSLVGSAVLPSSIASNSIAPFEWGKLSTQTNGFDGRLGELIIVDTLVTASDRASWKTNGIDFDHSGTVVGYRWRDNLDDSGPNGEDLTPSGIDSGDYGETSDYPSRAAAGPSGTFYTRTLKGGTQILYDTLGRQRWVTDRVGQQVEYRYVNETADAGLAAVQIAPHDREHVYRLHYDGSSRLDSIIDPGGRVLNIVRNGAKITSLIDPDSDSVTFGYSGNLATSWTSREDDTTNYAYVTGTPYLKTVTLPSTTAGTAVTTFTPIQAQGLATGQAQDTSVVLNDARIVIDGPLSAQDITTIAVNGYQAPVATRDAEGFETFIEYADTTFPMLATRSEDGVGLVSRATYDDRGNLETSSVVSTLKDGGEEVTSTTRYFRADANWPDFVTKVESPSGTEVSMAYDSATGNRVSQRDARAASEVKFEYYDTGPRAGQLRSTDLPGDAPLDTIKYSDDGNLSAVKSPLGFETVFYQDAFGRDTLVVEPVDSAQTVFKRSRTSYDVLNRPDTTWVLADDVEFALYLFPDSLTAAFDSVRTVNTYDDNGALTEVATSTNNRLMVHRTYVYDALGRRVSEEDEWQKIEHTVYDLAGNVEKVITRRGDTITTSYDLVGRPLVKIVPAVTYDSVGAGPLDNLIFSPPARKIPYIPNDGADGLVIPRDSIVFTYDGAGRILTANNRHAEVTRAYTESGLIISDTIRMRTYERSESCSTASPQECDYPSSTNYNKTWGIRYEYDAEGRRAVTHVPGLGAATYTYNPDHGQLERVIDPKGNQFRFEYDDQSRIESVYLPGGAVESRTYDVEGRLASRSKLLKGNSYFSYEELGYDAGGRVTTARRDQNPYDRSHYSGGGAVVGFTTDVEDDRPEYHVTDGLGNVLRLVRRAANDSIRYENFYSFSRMTSTVAYGIPTTSEDEKKFTFDDAGNNLITQQVQEKGNDLILNDLGVNFYDALGQLRFRQVYHHSKHDGDSPYGEMFDDGDEFEFEPEFGFSWNKEGGPPPTMRNYRVQSAPAKRGLYQENWYDALGRRIVINITQQTNDTLCNRDCVDVTEYTVWDGSQILIEDRTASSTAFNAQKYGGVVTYTHALGIDNPLSLHRESGIEKKTIIPHQDWRGNVKGATDISGDAVNINGFGWPGLEQTAAYGSASRGNQEWWGSLILGLRGMDGLTYQRNRYYDPVSGRFTQEDPIGLAGGLNLYGFAGGDPLNFRDPFGLCIWDGCVLEFTAAVALVGATAYLAAQASGQGTDAAEIIGPLAEGAVRSVRSRLRKLGEIIGIAVTGVLGPTTPPANDPLINPAPYEQPAPPKGGQGPKDDDDPPNEDDPPDGGGTGT